MGLISHLQYCTIQFSINWPPRSHTTILATYAPNPPSENHDFWISLAQWYNVPDRPKPHILLGDFNLIEEAADHHPDPPQASAALLDLRVNLHLIDGCRCTNPPLECRYTFAQPGNGSRSRIDRIYAMEDIISRALDWSIENPEIPTDHQLITIKIYDKNSPQIRHGCWAMKLFLLKDKKFLSDIENIGQKIADLMIVPDTSPQQALQTYIEHIQATAQQLTKEKIGIINSKTKKKKT